MSSSVIDYFAVLGRVSGPLQREPFRRDWSDDKTIISATDVLDEAITDIMVLTSDQSVPDESWSLMETTLEDNQVDAPFIAIRRYVDSKRLDYITDIKLALPNEQIPEGFELIAGAQTGSDAASLLGRGFLIIKRADASELRHWKSDPIIDDIAFLKKSVGEEVPEKYLEVELLSPALTHNHLHGRNAADISIVYHTRSGLGICDLSYTSATTDRYPQQDHDKLELPVAGLPLFAFPHGMHLTLADAGQFPLPLFFTFVFTDQDGKHFYVACLQFYEPVAVQDLQAVYRDMYGPDQEIQLPADKSVFCPKIICAVSQWPFYRAMRRFLRQLYSLSFSTLQCPLEYYIASVVHRVPFPLEGGRAFHVTLDVALISHTSKAMAPIEFQLPSPSDFPLMDVDFAGPLRCLSVEHLLAVYTLMLREAKLLFVCESNTMLTEVMETLRALLFPLSWASCFVPRLPAALTGLLQAPGGFMVGIHIPKETHGSTAAYLRSLHSCRSVVPGSYVVDLTANSISQYSGRSFDRLDTSKVDSLLKTLPFGPKFRLQSMLRKLSTEFSVGPQAVNLSEFDSAFELQSAEGLINAEKWENFPTVSVRDAFFTFLIDFLGDYSRYIIPPSEDLDADSYRTFQEEFSITQYLEQADKSTRSATELLLETQMFSALVQRRAEGRQQSLVLFERAGALVRDLGLSAGGHGHHLPSRLAGEVLEMPVPVHGLLAADVQWASLGITRQQQLRSSAGAVHYTEGVASPASSSVASSGLSGRHHLTYLSTGATGAMNVLRSGSIPLPHSLTQPVHNQRLDDLMTMWDFMNAPPTLREKSLTIDAAADISEVQRVREELSLPLSELHLDNPAFGPLIIPGPCKPFSDPAGAQLTGANPSSSSTISNNSSSPAALTFSYHAGWPVLREEFTDQALSCAVDPKVAELRALRHNYEQQTGKDVLLLVRPPGQRLSFEHHGKLINPAHIAASEDILAVASMVVDITSLVLTCLSVRATLQIKPASDLLQMLGVLAQLEHWDLLPALTDTAWRAVLVACAHGGGDLMRRVCCIVYQLIPSITGAMPDSLTYGCFLRALAAKKRHLGTLEPISLGKANKSAPVLYTTPEQTEALLDPYLYLEEMGVTWYIQRSALQGQTLGNGEDSSRGGSSNTNSHSSSAAHHRSAPVSPLAGMTGAMTKHLNLNKRFPVSLSFRSAENSPAGNTGTADQRPLSIKPEAARQTSGQFSLAEGPGMLVFSRPFTLLGVYPPRKVSEFSLHTPKAPAPGKLSAKLINRMDQLYAGALPHIRFLPPAPLAVPIAPTMDRSDSTVTNLSVSTASSISGDASPVVSHPGRMAQLSRAFFSKKTSATSPLPPAPLPTVVETSPAAVKTGPGSHLPPLAPPLGPSSGSAPASPNPMMSWTSKLRPTMFFGGSPKTSHLHTPQQADSHSSDVEMKEMSATLNFDDEDSGTEEDGGSDSESRGSQSMSSPPWNTLPDADSSASVSPMRPEETVDTIIPPPPLSAEVLEVEEQITPKSEISTATESLLDLDTEDAAAVVVSDEQDLFNADPPVLVPVPVQATTEDTEIVANDGENSRESPVVAAQPVDATEPTLTAKALPVDVVTLQAQLLQAFEEEFAAQGRALGIHSFTPCPHCGFAMLDEEVLTRWCHGSAYEAHVKGNPRSSSARNMCAVHAVSCKQCAQLFSPQLHVVCYSSNNDSKQDSEASDSLVSLWSETVSYLSPFGLRYELEALLMQHGAQAISTAWLRTHHPTVLWGLLWYSARLHLPSGLHHTAASHTDQDGSPIPAQSYLHPVVVGWRECTIRAKAGRILQGRTADFLTVQELFPGCSSEDAARLENTVVPALDGSPAGMRIAMVSFCECASVVEYGRSVGMSVARLVSVGLLSICYLHGKKQYTIPRGFDSIAQLNKDPLFEKSFVDAIKCVLSSVDLQRMGTTETELLAACASKTVVIVRNTLGFLC